MDYPRLLKMLRWPVAFLLLTCMATASWAQDQSLTAEERAKLQELNEEMTLETMGPELLARGADAVDRAIHVLDISQLRLYTSNMGSQMGRIFGGSSRASFPNMDGYRRAYWYQSSIALGFESGSWHPTDLVHESSGFHSSSRVDWEAKDGARGLQFSNPSQLISGYPMGAHATLPLTWPTSGWPAPESTVEVWDSTLSTWNKWERVGDENAYMVFDDKYAARENDGTSTSLGIEVKERVIAYGAMNLIFIQYEFTNTSSNNYTNVFVGQLADKGSPSTNDGGESELVYDNSRSLVYSRSEDWDSVTGMHWRGGGSTSQLTFVGYMVLESPTGSYREDDYDPANRGVAFRTAAINPMQDLTQAYHPDNILTRVALLDFDDRVGSPDEESLYGAISGNLTNMEAEPAFNIWKTGQTVDGSPILKQTNLDYRAYNTSWETDSTDHYYYSSSGPFTFPALSSFDYTVALVAGQTSYEMEDVADLAKHTFNIQFKGPAAPPAPKNFMANGITAGPGGREYDARIHAYPIHYAPSGNITLSWDNAAPLTTPDPSLNNMDFEGIRLFRSMDRGDTWGQRITNKQGSFVGWAPYRQWDLDDAYSGDDGLSYTYLGDDTGLVSTFWDENAIDGVEYWYAIASYDFGVFDGTGAQTLRSLQSAYGSNPGAPTVVAVVAGSRPSGYVEGEASVTGADRMYADLPTNSDATVSVTVANDAQVQNATYRLTTTLGGDYGSVTLGDNYGITLENVTTSTTLFTALVPDDDNYGTGLLPITDGLLITVDTDWNQDKDPDVFKTTTFPAEIVPYSGYGMNFGDKRFMTSTNDSDDLTSLLDDTFFPVEIHWSATNTQVGYTYTRSGYAFRGTANFPGRVYDVSDPANPRQVNVLWTVQSSRAAGDNEYAITSPADEATYRSYLSIMGDDYDAASTTYVAGTTYTGTPFPFVYNSWLGLDAAYLTSGQTVGQYLEGEVSYYSLTGLTQVGTTYEFSTTAPTISDSLETLDDIMVVPNPYYIYTDWDMSNNRRKIQFTNVPMDSEISIYTVSGELVAVLDHSGDALANAGAKGYNSNRVGTVDWNIWTYEFTEAAYGLYVFVCKTEDGRTKVGKFAIVR
ncbi:hypothetical protein ACFL6T_03980 [Candidatus Zixiibacteriota bacterium]